MTTRLVLLAALLVACTPTEPPAPSGDDGPTRVRIYQLLLRHFGNASTANVANGTLEQNGCGKFADIDAAAIAHVKSLGTTHVWLTGVPRQASLTAYPSVGIAAEDPDVVKGRAGSPYAVFDYFDTSPDYASEPANRLAEFDALVGRLHAAGLQVLIDLVPNHLARGYASQEPDSFGVGDDTTKFFAPDNAFFYLPDPPGQLLELARPEHWFVDGMDGRYAREDGQDGRTPKATGNNVTTPRPSASDWYETVKLNWGLDFTSGHTRFDPIPKTWRRFDRVLAFWQSHGVDGFRADFAHYVPAAAWQWLLGEARRRDPDAFFIAEAYAAGDAAPGSSLPNLVASGFDAIYDDPIYDRVKEVFQETKWANDLDEVQPTDFLRDRTVRYLENHDERRAASPLVKGGGDSGFGSAHAAFPAAATLYLGHGGPILFYAGQEVGEPGAGAEGFGGDDGRTTIFDYWAPPMLSALRRADWSPGRMDGAAGALAADYAKLLTLANEPAFRGGASYYGLSSEHRSDPAFGAQGRWMTAFIRYRPNRQAMLVVANFDTSTGYAPKVKLPARLLTFAGLDAGDTLTFTPRLGEVAGASASATRISSEGVALSVPASGVGVWEISNGGAE